MTGLLHISDAVSIAIHLCLRVADRGTAFSRSQTLSRELGLSIHHVQKVVQRLVREGLLETARGPGGGIRLAKDPSDLSLLDIHMAAGGETLVPHRCLLDPSICKGRACALGRMIEKENERIRKQMSRMTLAGLLRTLDPAQLDLTA